MTELASGIARRMLEAGEFDEETAPLIERLLRELDTIRQANMSFGTTHDMLAPAMAEALRRVHVAPEGTIAIDGVVDEILALPTPEQTEGNDG